MSEQLTLIRKDRAGSVSGGWTWPEDGAVIPVPYPLALELLGIRDGGFTVHEPEPEPEPEPDRVEEITEPAPPPAAAVTEPASRRPRGRAAVRE